MPREHCQAWIRPDGWMLLRRFCNIRPGRMAFVRVANLEDIPDEATWVWLCPQHIRKAKRTGINVKIDGRIRLIDSFEARHAVRPDQINPEVYEEVMAS